MDNFNNENDQQIIQSQNLNKEFPYVFYSIASFIVIYLLSYFIILTIFKNFFLGTVSNSNFLILNIIHNILSLIFVVLLASFTDLPLKNLLRFKLEKNLQIYGLVVVLFILFIIFLLFYSSFQDYLVPIDKSLQLIQLKEIIDSNYIFIVHQKSQFLTFIAVGFLSFIGPISEEIIYRGFFQNSLEQKLKPGISIIIVAVLFACVHFNLPGLIPLIVIGILFGKLASITKSLTPSILLHMLNNSFSAIMILIAINQYNSKFHESYRQFNFWISLIFVIITSILMYIVINYIRLESLKNKIKELKF